ncbi:cytochrome b5 domain-containing protein 1-like isoform X2 [Pollicipes pollicipes]|uniref:cytochrome b5 domain-containing protein 1-like isoform X2 n=1 Tax=Pollicipes pollicipes TaxID=41117 RepID=UPI00188539A7|nr:cytochrome b5 domain-containing protein 1-like isoform X2 [Pollicipes pollicipes]
MDSTEDISGEDIASLPKRPRYFHASEVKLHNRPDDIWVSFLGRVYDVTAMVRRQAADPHIRPLLAHAGKDISDWFDPKTRDLKRHVDPTTQVWCPYLPHGQLLGTPPPYPSSSWQNDTGRPWWRDEALYCVGVLSNRSRKIRLVNMLTRTETTLLVPEEATLWEILQRHLAHNAHAASYVWKFGDRELDMAKTLEQNGIPNESEDFYKLDLDEDSYLPAIFLYYSDDLTEL